MDCIFEPEFPKNPTLLNKKEFEKLFIPDTDFFVYSSCNFDNTKFSYITEEFANSILENLISNINYKTKITLNVFTGAEDIAPIHFRYFENSGCYYNELNYSRMLSKCLK